MPGRISAILNADEIKPYTKALVVIQSARIVPIFKFSTILSRVSRTDVNIDSRSASVALTKMPNNLLCRGIVLECRRSYTYSIAGFLGLLRI